MTAGFSHLWNMSLFEPDFVSVLSLNLSFCLSTSTRTWIDFCVSAEPVVLWQTVSASLSEPEPEPVFSVGTSFSFSFSASFFFSVSACACTRVSPSLYLCSAPVSPSDPCRVSLPEPASISRWESVSVQPSFSELQFQFVSIRPKSVAPCSLPQSVILYSPLGPVLHHPVPLSQVILCPSSWWHPERPGGMLGAMPRAGFRSWLRCLPLPSLQPLSFPSSSFLEFSIPCFAWRALSSPSMSRPPLEITWPLSPACPAAPHWVSHSVNTESSFQPVFARLSMLASCCSIPAIAVTCTWLLAFLPQSFWNGLPDFTACACGWQSKYHKYLLAKTNTNNNLKNDQRVESTSLWHSVNEN